MKKLTTNEFIKKSKEIHDNKYDYSLVDYINSRTKVKIICPIHGVFEQKPNSHLQRQNCPICMETKKSLKSFIVESNIVHNNKYDYSLSIYINAHTKVKIICPIHGVFEQTPNVHTTKKCGCKKCSDKKQQLDKDEFITKSNKIHHKKYDYSLVKYNGSYNKVKIICPIHGVFEQTPNNHMNNSNECPLCKSVISKGEKKLISYLENKKIKYVWQYKFNGCKNVRQLLFDFYLPYYNMCIEYDGLQHFESVDYWGGDEGLKERQKRDKIKNEYCEENNISLIRIRYDENICEKINEKINN
jgi:very-short-patch-repair endonuclease